MQIVVADDDPMARLGCRAMLEGAGHRVSLAQDGAVATDLIENGEIDLLLLDVLMPRKEGLETLMDIKRRFPGIVVVMMSAGGARTEFDFLAAASKLGADRVLRKPFSQADLLALIEEVDPGVGVGHG